MPAVCWQSDKRVWMPGPLTPAWGPGVGKVGMRGGRCRRLLLPLGLGQVRPLREKEAFCERGSAFQTEGTEGTAEVEAQRHAEDIGELRKYGPRQKGVLATRMESRGGVPEAFHVRQKQTLLVEIWGSFGRLA